MKKVFIFAAIAAIGLVACNRSENELETSQTKNDVKLTQSEIDVLCTMRNGESNRVSLDEATKIAKDVIGFLDGETSTKSGNSRQIASITTLKSEKQSEVMTKSVGNDDAGVEMPDTLAYLFNFADSAGYTIIAADTRVSPVLCYTGIGTLGDTINNPGIAIFLEGAEYYIERSIAEAEAAKDSLLNDILAKLAETGISDTTYITHDNTDTKSVIDKPLLPDQPTSSIPDEIRVQHSYGPWIVYESVGPLLPIEWGQGSPYNESVKNKNCSTGTAPTGCVATATAQIMAYWSYPLVIDGYSFDWNLIRQYTSVPNRYNGVGTKNIIFNSPEANNVRNQIARLMERIGVHIGMDYTCKESGAWPDDAVAFLKGLGFKSDLAGSSVFDILKSDMIKNSLDHGRPVIASGYSEKSEFLGISFLYSLSHGHTWVIDGYLKRKQEDHATVTVTSYKPQPNGMIMIVTTTTNEIYTAYSPYYLHNNWGWDSYHNGYFVAGSFNSNQVDLPSNTKSSEPYNYQYGIEIYPFIYR